MLILPIKKKWFDMILSGQKTEEYREIKPYYDSRFRNAFGLNTGRGAWERPYPVMFRNGYSSKSPSFVAEIILSIGEGKPEWGAEPGKEYYILHICSILKGFDKSKNLCSKCDFESSRLMPCNVCDELGGEFVARS